MNKSRLRCPYTPSKPGLRNLDPWLPGDHNGAFGGLDDTKKGRAGLWNMCARLLRMSSLYNVVYKRVNDLQEAVFPTWDIG